MRRGIRRAVATRRELGLAPEEPVDPVDAAHELGLEVRYLDLTSLEGVLVRSGSPTIILGSLRPSGRRNFTCAHEIGHFLFGHDARVEGVTGTQARGTEPSELMADAFAGFFLMPRSAVEHALAVRDLPDLEEGLAALRIAQWLGVGYETLLTHASTNLRLLSPAARQRLMRIAPSKLTAPLLPPGLRASVWLVDRQWHSRAVDVEVGDVIVVDDVAVIAEGDCLTGCDSGSTTTTVRATGVGRGRLRSSDGEWVVFVRIQRRAYAGLARFRHLPTDGATGA